MLVDGHISLKRSLIFFQFLDKRETERNERFTYSDDKYTVGGPVWCLFNIITISEEIQETRHL